MTGLTAPSEMLSIAALKGLVRDIADFPKPGIIFRDITTLLADGPGFRSVVLQLAEQAERGGAQKIAGMEARGFIFGASVAAQLGLGFIPIRKPGKLPVATIGVDYDLEYGQDRLEMDPGAVATGERVAIVDDLIATGGTARAACTLLRRAGAEVEHAHFVIDLPDLGGAASLSDMSVNVTTLLSYPGG